MNKRPLHEIFDAMYHGKYRFDEFVHAPIDGQYEVVVSKSNSGRRVLKPRAALKTYHGFLNLFLFERLPINERVVFSYRKGFSALQAVKVHGDSKYFYQTDIQSFFNSIDESLIRSTISRGIGASPVSDLDQYLDRILELVCIDGALPVGFPASAPLSNAVLCEFDLSLEAYCSAHELLYTRYADDIIISASRKDGLIGLTDEIQARLNTCSGGKLRLNAKKTKYFQVGGKIKILGMMILPNGRITPDSKRKRDLELWLHFFQNDREKFNEMVSGDDEQARLDRVSGLLNYMNSIDPEYLNKLRRKFGLTTIDLILHRSLGS
jgi:RNA-directed DNA polymerase